ncbi:MAG TPA: tetratricopeptide repeat protein [Kofleriaceae bacterium]|nr:tetratricopeptide repeat protein [Kofleriaceae bacterium]
MAEDERTRRWQRISSPAIGVDPVHALRNAIGEIRNAPRDQEARRQLRALAVEQGSWEQLALLLEDEARAAHKKPELAAAMFEELADVHENLDQAVEAIAAMENVVELQPDDVDHHDRLAWLYRKAGAAVKAAEAFEKVAGLAQDDRSRAALRAAGRLYRDAGKHEQAVRVYRAIVKRRPSDLEAWRALDEILTDLGQWTEVAEVRGALADRATGVDKAVLLRSQARAFEKAGEVQTAAKLVASAASYAPEDVSGLVDYATVLAREGRPQEAAEVLGQRIQEAISDGAPSANISALRLRLVDVLDEAGDHVGAAAVLDKLLTASPEYAPALERLVQHAARGNDPKAHAAALLRQAASIEDSAEAAPLVIEAARQYRAAGELRSAAHAFEHASELTPDDEKLVEEMHDAQTALVVEVAAAEAAAGDVKGAERRLRKILETRPHHLESNIALVDSLSQRGRLEEAAEHLRETLASAPEDTSEDLMAQLVFRFAKVRAALGETDEAHQLLHEAHHLARRDLLITLALGESCLSRKLWREAAIHLGSLADHPQARRHAAAVAAGLVKAGQAEVRALKPANAAKHYDAAVKLDPNCAPAWHQLAELATERGDTVRAAEHLEREAAATVEPAARVRLYDALGDLALDVLGDAERAERCWSAVSQLGSAEVLTKLLALQRKRGATAQAMIARGETAERLAAVTDDRRAAKELTEEAAQAFAAGGDRARARAVADYLVSQHSLDADTIFVATSIAAGDHETSAAWLRRALGAWEAAKDKGEGDPRRAELWRRLGDAEKGRRNERAALDAYQRAVVAAPDSDGALAARRGLIELAASFGRSANTSRIALVEAEQVPTEVISTARELARTGDPEDARAMFELARALGVELLAEDERFLDANAPRAMASDEAYAAALDEAERFTLIDDEADGVLAEVFALLGEAGPLVSPDAKTALDAEALSDARRIPATSDAAAVAIYPQIAKALGGPATLMYANPSRNAPDLRLLLASPPVLILGPRLAGIRARSRSDVEYDVDAELRFRLGRAVELSRPHRLFALGSDPEVYVKLVAALVHAFGQKQGEPAQHVAYEAERLRKSVPVALRSKLADKLAGAGPLDAAAYLAACERAADRAGLVACGHPGIAIHLAGGPERARHLVRLAASQAYLAAQKKLRRR